MQPLTESENTIDGLCDVLVCRGYQEAVTYSFVDPGLQAQHQPGYDAGAAGQSHLIRDGRDAHQPVAGFTEAVQYNLNRQKSRLRFFEHGLRFYSRDERQSTRM